MGKVRVWADPETTPVFDGGVTSPDNGTNQTSFNDRPTTYPGQPISLAIFFIDPATGTNLKQINWQNTGTGHAPGTIH
jgi:hypothetical protein